MKGYKRHVRIFNALRVLFGWIFRLMFNTDFERFDTREPCLVIANHVTKFDPIFLGMAAKDHLYFVASDHITRRGLVSRLLIWVFNPITRTKGGTDAQAAMSTIRAIRKGASVALFAEGNTTYNGVNSPIFPATGKLVQSTGARLITYRFTGGYFSFPRWAASRRRGSVTGRVAGIYEPAQLKAMSVEEVNELLARDIYEDAYATQEKRFVAYRGKHLAENLETALYVCPCCCGLDTIHSKNDAFSCSCGMHGTYDIYGMLNSETLPYKTVTEWDAWQDTQIPALAYDLKRNPVRDEGVRLFRIGEKRRGLPVARGTMTLYADRLDCAGVELPIERISDMALVGRNGIMLTADGTHYEIRPPKGACTRKYLALYQELRKTLYPRGAHAQ